VAAQAPQISAIIPVRNRSGVGLTNCLRSLRWQELDEVALEIVVSDFGSDPEHAKSIEQAAAEHRARVVRTDRPTPGTGACQAAPRKKGLLYLRGSKPFVPRGVHRFSSFEESQAWSMRMMARSSRDHRP
jgi:hypothetical protein